MIEGYGFKGFEVAVDKFERRMIKQIKRVVSETAEMMVSQMKALAPVGGSDGGNLKDSIGVTYAQGGLTAIIKVGAFYGIYVEHGTGIYAEKGDGRKTPWVYFKDGKFYYTEGMEAQPFFYPSLEVASKHFASEMNKLG